MRLTSDARGRLLITAHRRMVAADHAAYDAAKALQCASPEDVSATFEIAAVCRDYATDCRARYHQAKGVAL